MNEKNNSSAMLKSYRLILIIVGVLSIPFTLLAVISRSIVAYVGIFFLLFLFVLTIIEIVLTIRYEKWNKKLLSGSIPAHRTKAIFISSKYKGGSNSMNVKNSEIYYVIKYEYTDQRGIRRIAKTKTVFSPKEVSYLKTKSEFEILCYDNHSVIVENLNVDNIDSMPTFNSVLGHNEEIKNMSQKTPFMGNNTLSFSMFVGFIIYTIVGLFISFIIIRFANMIIGWIFIVLYICIYVAWLHSIIQMINANKKGEQMLGKLIDVCRVGSRDNRRYYAYILIDNKEYKVLIQDPRFAITLKDYIGNNIPVKKYKQVVVIDDVKFVNTNL